MQHYWGIPAILTRLGYSVNSSRYFPVLVQKYQIPCYRRRKGIRLMYYSNDELLTRWDIANSKRHYEDLVADVLANRDRRYKARERKRKAPVARILIENA